MNIREYEFLLQTAKERRAVLECDLERSALLAQGTPVSSARPRNLISLAVTVVLLVVIVASTAHLFV